MDMREEFEAGWGNYNETQGIYFIPELNMYGCDLYVYQAIADRKSSAWYYFQKGWQASRESLVVELPFLFPHYKQEVVEALTLLGIRTK